MKCKTLLICLLLVSLAASVLTGCADTEVTLEESLEDDYLKAVEGEFPEDLRLTIYYIYPYILTRRPLSVENLINLTDVNKVIVESKELSTQVDLLRKLDPSILQPAKEEAYVNARMYYVFEAGDDKLLEVIISTGSVFVNGFAVEYHPVVCELIAPFLPEDARADWISWTSESDD